VSLPPVSFFGVSDFADSFQTILERTFTVANLPIQGLQTEQTLLLGRQTELGSLASDLQALRQSFSSLGILGSTGAVAASSSNLSAARVAVTGTPSPLSFDIDVTSAATAAQETTSVGVPTTNADGLAADGIFALTLDATTTNFDLLTVGSGRTSGTSGSATPDPKVSVQVDFSNGLSGSITAELESFFVASSGPSGAAAGDSVSVTFTSSDGGTVETITSAALSGGEDAAAIAGLLNAEIALNAQLSGKLSFSAEGGALKLVVDDSAGAGFSFTSSNTGSVVSGLEGGGTVGGHSAEEIAAALNAEAALDQTLVNAGVSFAALNGEVKVLGSQAFDITVSDDAQGTGFVSGLSGTQSVAGFDNTINGLRDAINAQNLGVAASIINTSSNPVVPDYHLTLSADQTGAATLTLEDSGSSNLLTSSNQGTNAVFTVNGLPVSNSSNLISDFAPGLALTIVGAGQTTVRTADDRIGVSNALADIAVNYNAVVSRVAQSVGENAGLLSGHVLVRETQQVLRDVSGYFVGGDVGSISALGLTFDDNGVLSFDSASFDGQAATDFDAIRSFIGTTSDGFAGNGLLRLADIADPVTGQIQTAISLIEESDESISARISEAQDRVDREMTVLEAKLAAADTLLAQLESQRDVLTQLFEVQFQQKE